MKHLVFLTIFQGLKSLAICRENHDKKYKESLMKHSFFNFSGIKINGNIFASSSYDGSVCLWTLDGNRITVFNEPSHLLRCIGFSGNTVVSGDFGGYLHFWEIEIANPATPVPGCVKIKKYHAVPSHKSHIVCIQQNAHWYDWAWSTYLYSSRRALAIANLLSK